MKASVLVSFKMVWDHSKDYSLLNKLRLAVLFCPGRHGTVGTQTKRCIPHGRHSVSNQFVISNRLLKFWYSMPDFRNCVAVGCFEHLTVRKALWQILFCWKTRLADALSMYNYMGPPQTVRWTITRLIDSRPFSSLFFFFWACPAPF